MREDVDEFLLAAYLSQGLPPEIRQEIELYLLENSGARDLLGMANDALEEATSFEKGAVSKAPPILRNTPVGASRARKKVTQKPSNDEEKQYEDNSFLRMQIGVASIPVLVVVAGLLIWSLFPKSSDQSPELGAGATMASMWMPAIDAEQSTISWPAISSASNYAVVVFNPDDNSIVNLETTSATMITDLQGLAYTFRPDDATNLVVWIMALDGNGAVLKSSASVQLVSNRY